MKRILYSILMGRYVSFENKMKIKLIFLVDRHNVEQFLFIQKIYALTRRGKIRIEENRVFKQKEIIEFSVEGELTVVKELLGGADVKNVNLLSTELIQ